MRDEKTREARPPAPDFAAIFDAMPGINLVLAPDAPRFTMLAATNGRLEATMTTREDTLGRPLFEVFPDANPENEAPSGVGNLQASLETVLRTGAPHRMAVQRYDLQRPDGSWEERYWEPINVPVLLDGEVRYIVHRVEDVTSRVRGREVERLLTESEAARAEAEAARAKAEAAADRLARLHRVSLALAGEAAPDALVAAVVREGAPAVGATVGVVTRLSDDRSEFRLLAAYGVPKETAMQWTRVLNGMPSPHAEALATRTPFFQGAPDEYASRWPGLARVRRTAGIQAAVTLPLIVAGEPFGVLSFGFDTPQEFTLEDRDFLVTVASQCAQALERARLFDAERGAREAAESARADAEFANRAKSEFLAVMSHELRTPLNAIGGYAELMEMGIRGPVTDQQREDLRRLQLSQRHLLGLINEVLNYAKLETGTVHYELGIVRVSEVLAAAEALVAPQATAKGLTLAVESCPPAPDGTPASAHADTEKVRQILVNLLSNAVKFTARGGHIALSCEAVDDTVRIRVHDTGIGVAPEQRERIFEPFVQVRADLTRTAEGTGLGLAISRDLARGMGGDLTIESEPGAGSTFTLTLPRASLRPPPTRGAP